MVHGIFSRKWVAVRRAFLAAVMVPTIVVAHTASASEALGAHTAHAAHTDQASKAHLVQQPDAIAQTPAASVQAAPQSRAVQGDVIPQDFLELEKKRCMDGCTAFNEEGLCVSLCSCSVDQFKTRLNFPDYLALSVEMIEDRVSDKNRTLLDTIARYCVDAYEKTLASEAAAQNQPKVDGTPTPTPSKPGPQQ